MVHIINYNLGKLLSKSKFSKIIYKQLRGHCGGEKAGLAIIGQGPGGLTVATTAAAKGIKNIVVVEKWPMVGGNCINYGCIPTKSLLCSSHHYYQIKTGLFDKQGVITSNLQIDLNKMMASKTYSQKFMGNYMENTLKTLNIKMMRGKGSITGPNEITVEENGKKQSIQAEKIVIATGSEVRPFPGIEIDEKQIRSSDTVISMDKVPKRMVIIGAGIIGIELGSVWSRLGSEVTIINDLPMIINSYIDKDIRAVYQCILERQGMKFLLNKVVKGATKSGDVVKCKVADAEGGCETELECDTLFVCIGRLPFTRNLGLENVGIKLDGKGCIPVGPDYQTSVPGIYAIGDVINGPMTAHKAIEDGYMCVENIVGNCASLDLKNIATVVHTHPELAAIGQTEEQLQQNCIPYKVTWGSVETNGRAVSELDNEGCVKALLCPNTNKILGTHILCPHAGEIINEAVVAYQYDMLGSQIFRVVHSHPSYSKLLKGVYSG